MKRETREILYETVPIKRRPTRDDNKITERSKEELRKGGKGRVVAISPSQPHSKTLNR